MISAVVSAADVEFPVLTGRVVDNAHILDTAAIDYLEQKISAHEQESSDQIVVVTVPDLKNIPIEEYGYRLGRHWGIGQKNKNNGVLLIIAPNDRLVRIETGYGLEGVLTDAASSVIINRLITPEFKKGDYNAGVIKGVDAIIAMIKGENINDLKPQHEMEDNRLAILLFIFILFLLWLKRGRGSAGPFIGGWLLGRGFGRNDNDDDGPSFGGGGGSFGGGGSTGRW